MYPQLLKGRRWLSFAWRSPAPAQASARLRRFMRRRAGRPGRWAPLLQLLGHPRAAVTSNAALAAAGVPNPAAYGGFPRLLGRYAGDHAVLPLEEATRRATSLPADRAGLRDVGRIAEGYRAGLVILDPATVADAGWPGHLPGPSAGIRDALIAGRPVLQGGALAGTGGGGRLTRAAPS